MTLVCHFYLRKNYVCAPERVLLRKHIKLFIVGSANAPLEDLAMDLFQPFAGSPRAKIHMLLIIDLLLKLAKT